MRQIGNTCNVISNGLEQMMTLLILVVGLGSEKKSNPVPLVFEMRKQIARLTPLIPKLFITHAMPKNLLVDEVVRIGQGVLSAVSDLNDTSKKEVERGMQA